jgi:hypothetical protein
MIFNRVALLLILPIDIPGLKPTLTIEIMALYSITAQAILSRDDLIIDYHPEATFNIDNTKKQLADSLWREREQFATARQIRFFNGYL